MNLILTTDCQRKCKYCLAKDNINSPMQFTMENFKKAIAWIEMEKELINRVALLGGEPTIHPLFIDFLKYLLPKKLGVLVFTNAMIENNNFYKNILDVAVENGIRSFPELGFCVNINEPKYRNNKEDELQDTFFRKLGRVSSLSFNIFEETFDPYFLITTIKKYNLIGNIRIELAMPLGNRNDYLKLESYNKVAIKIMEFIRKTTKNNIYVGFDCGFTRCMFTESDIQELDTLKTSSITFDCGPSIDIYPNLEIASCYPMSKILKAEMSDYPSVSNLFFHLEYELSKFSTIFNECKTCTYLINNECSGGCKAYKSNG